MLLELALLIFSGTAVTIAVRLQGAAGVFWCYPAVALFCLLRPARTSWLLGGLLLIWSSMATLRFVGPAAAFACAASLALVILTLAVMEHVFGDVRRQLAEQAITDPLTGAFNRRCLDACLATAIERLHRTGEAASLAMIDVDHFKTINDELGHAAGDAALKALVSLLVGRARRLDVVFRIGGEEFALLLAGATHSDALQVADDLRRLIAESDLVDGRRLSISVGVSELRRDHDASQWLDEADAALYRAKRGGRNRVVGATSARARFELTGRALAPRRTATGR